MHWLYDQNRIIPHLFFIFIKLQTSGASNDFLSSIRYTMADNKHIKNGATKGHILDILRGRWTYCSIKYIQLEVKTRRYPLGWYDTAINQLQCKTDNLTICHEIFHSLFFSIKNSLNQQNSAAAPKDKLKT